MVRRNRTQEQLIALFVLGALLLLPPLIVVFSSPVRILGIPVLYLYLFVAWAALIGMTAAIVRRIDKVPSGGDGARPGPDVSGRQSDA